MHAPFTPETARTRASSKVLESPRRHRDRERARSGLAPRVARVQAEFAPGTHTRSPLSGSRVRAGGSERTSRAGGARSDPCAPERPPRAVAPRAPPRSSTPSTPWDSHTSVRSQHTPSTVKKSTLKTVSWRSLAGLSSRRRERETLSRVAARTFALERSHTHWAQAQHERRRGCARATHFQTHTQTSLFRNKQNVTNKGVSLVREPQLSSAQTQETRGNTQRGQHRTVHPPFILREDRFPVVCVGKTTQGGHSRPFGLSRTFASRHTAQVAEIAIRAAERGYVTDHVYWQRRGHDNNLHSRALGLHQCT